MSEPTPANPATYTYDAMNSVFRGLMADSPPDDTSSGNSGLPGYIAPDPNDPYNSPDIGGSIRYQFDSSGRDTIQQTDAAGITTQFQYDTRQGVTELNGGDPLGNTNQYEYDEIDRKIDFKGTLNAGATNVDASGESDFQNLTQSDYYQSGGIFLDPGTAGPVTYDVDLKLTNADGLPITLFNYDHAGTLDSSNPGFLISPTLIPLEDLTGSLETGIFFELQYTLDVTGAGKVDYDFALTPEPLGGGTLLAMLGAWSMYQAALRARTCRK